MTDRRVLLPLALAAGLLAGCGGDDDSSDDTAANEPADAVEATDTGDASTDTSADTSTAPVDDGDDGSSTPTGGTLGVPVTATVVVDGGDTYEFVGDGTATGGQCREIFGVLDVNALLVSVSGNAMPDGSGDLQLTVPLNAGDGLDSEVWLDVPGANWYAGSSSPAGLSGVDVLALSLTATETSASGTQDLVPLVSGVNPDITASFDVSCG